MHLQRYRYKMYLPPFIIVPKMIINIIQSSSMMLIIYFVSNIKKHKKKKTIKLLCCRVHLLISSSKSVWVLKNLHKHAQQFNTHTFTTTTAADIYLPNKRTLLVKTFMPENTILSSKFNTFIYLLFFFPSSSSSSFLIYLQILCLYIC